MLVREKGKKDAEPVGMGWDEAQAAIAAGTHEVAEGSGHDGTIGGPTEFGGDEDDLEHKTRAELDKLAEERGVDVSQAKTNADVIEALRAA